MTEFKLLPFQMRISLTRLTNSQDTIRDNSAIEMKITHSTHGVNKESLYLCGMWITFVRADIVSTTITSQEAMRLIQTVRIFNDRVYN